MRRQFGIFAATTTPFDEQGAIDLDKLVAHARSCLAAGCAGISVFGTTGEGPSIGSAERRQVLEALRRGGLAADRIVPGIAASSVADAAAAAMAAHEAGCRALLVTPPIFFKEVADAGVTEWYAAFLAQFPADGPQVILYNIPQHTGVPISRETIAALLARLPGRIMGIKDSSGDWSNTLMLLETFPDLAVLVGDERLLERGARKGAAGSISGVANFRADLLNAVMAGAPADPGLGPLVDALVRFPSTPAVKAMVAHLTGDPSWLRVRPPLLALDEAQARALGRAYDELFAGVEA